MSLVKCMQGLSMAEIIQFIHLHTHHYVSINNERYIKSNGLDYIKPVILLCSVYRRPFTVVIIPFFSMLCTTYE